MAGRKQAQKKNPITERRITISISLTSHHYEKAYTGSRQSISVEIGDEKTTATIDANENDWQNIINNLEEILVTGMTNMNKGIPVIPPTKKP